MISIHFEYTFLELKWQIVNLLLLTPRRPLDDYGFKVHPLDD